LSQPRVEREFKLIEKKGSQEERMQVFSKNAFKRGAIQFYARYAKLIDIIQPE